MDPMESCSVRNESGRWPSDGTAAGFAVRVDFDFAMTKTVAHHFKNVLKMQANGRPVMD